MRLRLKVGGGRVMLVGTLNIFCVLFYQYHSYGWKYGISFKYNFFYF